MKIRENVLNLTLEPFLDLSNRSPFLSHEGGKCIYKFVVIKVALKKKKKKCIQNFL
jgi:hypothetical protein